MDSSIIKNALAHLQKQPIIGDLVKKQKAPKFNQSPDPFDSLIRLIIYQQISGKAAKAIHNRFLDLFEKQKPTPKNIINQSLITLNKIGLSKQKIKYIKEISNYFLTENKDLSLLSNNQIENELIKLNGIGKWTIDMFLMFSLFRTDILPTTDLGIKKGFKILYNLDNLPSEKFMIEKSLQWQPYRTIAAIYLWNIVDDENFW